MDFARTRSTEVPDEVLEPVRQNLYVNRKRTHYFNMAQWKWSINTDLTCLR